MQIYISAVLLSTSTAKALISELVQRGYSVSPPTPTGKTIWEGEASCMLFCTVAHRFSTKEVAEAVMEDVKGALLSMDSMWHAITVYAQSYILWSPSNIKLPKKSDDPVAPPKEVTRFDMMDLKDA